MRSMLGDSPAATVNKRSATIVAAILFLGLFGWIAIIGTSRKAREGIAWPFAALAVAAAMTTLPPIRRRVARMIDAIREPSRGARWKIALAIAGCSTLYLLFTAVRQRGGVYSQA